MKPFFSHMSRQVLRAYDNRVMYTSRRPDVYLDFLAEETSEICSFADRDLAGVVPPTYDGAPPPPLPFGERMDGSDTRDWVWQFRGKFTVISVPFYKGRHHARRISEFIPVLRQLKRLHENGFVHGDLRCCNIVFGAGRLIDFDFGGKVDRERGSPTYPRGYKQALIDGHRRGAAGKPVTIIDDMYAMTAVIFRLHRIEPPAAADDPEEQENPDYYRKLAALDAKMRSFIALPDKVDGDFGTVQLDVSNHIEALVAFLLEAEQRKWTATPDQVMLENLANYGYVVTGLQGRATTRKGTEPATGSLEKDIMAQTLRAEVIRGVSRKAD